MVRSHLHRQRIATITTVVALGAGGLAGCGDDGQTLTRAEFTDQANAICVDADATIGEALGPLFSGEPTPEDLQGALDVIVSTSRSTLDQIAELDPPSEIASQVDDMLAAFETANDDAEAQGLAFFDGEDDPWAASAEIAGDLGIDSCAGG